jgi:hypothetical protein
VLYAKAIRNTALGPARLNWLNRDPLMMSQWPAGGAPTKTIYGGLWATHGYTCLFCFCKSAQHPRMTLSTLSYTFYIKIQALQLPVGALRQSQQRPSTGHGRGGTSRSRLPGSLSAGKK